MEFVFCFNPLLRGVGILTMDAKVLEGAQLILVSIPFFGAWVFLPPTEAPTATPDSKFQSPSSGRGYSYLVPETTIPWRVEVSIPFFGAWVFLHTLG